MRAGVQTLPIHSGFWLGGRFQRCDRTQLKDRVRKGEIKLLLGTDAASEGLNLQRLGTLINIDLPWNPTRLEQRKGRIQRIGQARNKIWIANLRYRDSVEDKVHRVLADRLQASHEFRPDPRHPRRRVGEGGPQRRSRDRRTDRSDHLHPQPLRQEIQQGGGCVLGDLRVSSEPD